MLGVLRNQGNGYVLTRRHDGHFSAALERPGYELDSRSWSSGSGITGVSVSPCEAWRSLGSSRGLQACIRSGFASGPSRDQSCVRAITPPCRRLGGVGAWPEASRAGRRRRRRRSSSRHSPRARARTRGLSLGREANRALTGVTGCYRALTGVEGR